MSAASDKNQSFKEKVRILENFIHHHEFNYYPILKGFSDKIGGDVNKCDFVSTFGRPQNSINQISCVRGDKTKHR